jgi:CxxC motif-containing protein (DUF1111 family)
MRPGPLARFSGRWPLACGLAALLGAGPAPAKEPAPGRPAADDRVAEGRELFARVWTPNDPRSRGGDGLGPVFNAQSCLQCHDRGGPGGAGSAERNIEIATAAGPGAGFSGYQFAYAFGMDLAAGRFEYRLTSGAPGATRQGPKVDPALAATVHPGFRQAGSVLLHLFGTDPGYASWRSKVAGNHGGVVVRTSPLNPPALFGAGRIDAIPDEAIEAAARRKAPSASRVKGRVSRLPDGRVGRFGWKAQTAKLKEFVLTAAATEIGLEVPGHHQAADPRLPGIGAPGLDMDRAQCEALAAYVRSLPAPVERVPADADEAAQVKAGEAAFREVSCAGCHLPKLGDVEGIYSDLLLHEMGPELGDTGPYGVFAPGAAAAPPAAGEGVATAREWRTPPLWGLRDSAPYLHDGQARTVDQAIARHGGQGAASAQRFARLSPRRKQQLVAFLMSLSAPTP